MLKYPDRILPAFFISFAAMFAANMASAQDTAEKLFKQCRSCHQVGTGASHQFGPVLNGVMGTVAASVPGYEYSEAFAKAGKLGLRWDDETMDAFLAEPMQNIKGTKMSFPGVPDEQHRKTLIDYLKQFDAEGNNSAIIAETLKPPVPQPRKPAAEFQVPTHGVLHLGRVALEEEVSAWDIDVRPDGVGLPKGSGNAVAGGELYDAHCAACHGVFGEGMGRWPVLAGGLDTLTEERPEKTIGSYWPYLSTVFDYIRRSMPFGNARSLSDNDVYAITAYLLYLNDQAEEDFELSSENFTQIRLPNEKNFIADNRHQENYRQVAETDICMRNCKPEPARVIQRARVLDVTPDE